MVYIPFLSSPSRERQKRRVGGGRGGGGVRTGGSSGGGSTGRTTFSSPAGRTVSNGGGAPRTVPAGTPFAGRSIGGGQRSAVYGGRGALGYPLGVAGLGFGFGFWPLYWYGGYRGNDEYGPRNNSSRPGGPHTAAGFNPSALSNAATSPPQYQLYGDNSTVYDVAEDLIAQCQVTFTGDSTQPDVNLTLVPQPEPQFALQYYREASFVLLSYIANGSADAPPPNVATNGLFIYPATAQEALFESCINNTIGSYIPIADGEGSAALFHAPTAMGVLALTFATLALSSL